MGALKYRERIGLVLAKDVCEWLRAENARTEVPISRIVEKAIRKLMEEKK